MHIDWSVIKKLKRCYVIEILERRSSVRLLFKITKLIKYLKAKIISSHIFEIVAVRKHIPINRLEISTNLKTNLNTLLLSRSILSPHLFKCFCIF